MDSKTLSQIRYTPEEIEGRATLIYDRLIHSSRHLQNGNFERISTTDLRTLFELYDAEFFGNFFRNHYNGNIRFYLSSRMTRAAGKTIRKKGSDVYEIGIATSMLFQNFNANGRDITVCGLPCKDRLEAMMRTMEHEMVHVIEYIVFGDSNCSAPCFKNISNNIFGHTASAHDLVTRKEIAYKEYNLKVGDKVFFNFEGKTYSGIVYKITKRATVMVEDGQGQYADREGKKYCKFYVPISSLQPVAGGSEG